MRLALTLPAQQPEPAADVYIIEIATGVILRVNRGCPMPAGWRAWVEAEVRKAAPVPEGHALRQKRLERSSDAPRQTSAGWPQILVSYAVVSPQGEEVEERMGSFYRLLYNAASAVVVVRDRAAYATVEGAVMQMFDTAECNWPKSDTATLKEILGQ